MKNKIQNFWYSLGVNTKSILITVVILLGIFSFLGILYLFMLYPLVGVVSFFTLAGVLIFTSVRKGMIENQDI